ncbi:MAG TPA: thioredoxin [Rhodobacteraceae bacterium]|nr:thioredoxin [Paracoccaceae bacterium]
MRKILAMVLAILLAGPALAHGPAVMGDDGLHKTDWMRETFKDLREDLAEANAEGKRLMIIVEQRGCIYCNKMHEEVFPLPEIHDMIHENFFVVQLNMFGDVEVTDFDGEVLSEKELARKWGLLFTPTMMFFPESVPETVSGAQAAVATIPGAFGKYTTGHLMEWVVQKGYEGDESFQKYHARRLTEKGLN